MAFVKKDTIGGFNQFLKDQKAAGKNASLTLVQFDTGGIDTVHENVAIDSVPELTDRSYVPRGGTPLLDALGQTIERTGANLKAIPEAERPDKVVFVIITDGQENASRTFNKSQVGEMVMHQTDVYKWLFVYLGANQDAFSEARQIGIAAAHAANYATANMASAFAATSSNLSAYRRTGLPRAMGYSNEQRERLNRQ